MRTTGAPAPSRRGTSPTAELFRETPDYIPNARLLLVDGSGHVASGRRATERIRSLLVPTDDPIHPPPGDRGLSDRDAP